MAASAWTCSRLTRKQQNKEDESDKDEERKCWFCTHSQDEDALFVLHFIGAHCLKWFIQVFGGKRMKKFIVVALTWVLCAAAAHAGVSGVGLDAVSTSYTASTGVFSMSEGGLVATVDYDDNTQASISSTSFSLTTNFVSRMSFTGGTFRLTDSASAVILSGNVLLVDFYAGGRTISGEGKAQVLVSNLAGYPVGPSDIVSITFKLAPAFTGFSQNYTGDSKVDLIVPEPATMLLVGLGAVLLRKKK